MSYYSELNVYTPTSGYNGLLRGPYANHSSIVASNILPPKQFHRVNFRGFAPHLTTISESRGISPLRRVDSPKIVYRRRPVKINTADIDVSVNKYRQYETKRSPKKASPAEAKPSAIRRDRPTVRLQTIHKDTLGSWRDNFEPDELVTEAKVRKKTPGELLKEKFLIRSKSKENVALKKAPSFKDICDVIGSAVQDLNPGQPIDVRRRQSRQVSHDDVLREIRRTSSALSAEDVELLDALIDAENDLVLGGDFEPPPPAGSYKPRRDSSLTDMIKDISQVEIEMIPARARPVIKSSVGDIEEKVKPSFKAVIDEVSEVKKEKRFRFNVTVEEIPERPDKSNLLEGVVRLPHPEHHVVTSILKKKSASSSGETKHPRLVKCKSEEAVSYTITTKVNRTKSAENVKLTIVSVEQLSKARGSSNVPPTFPKPEKKVESGAKKMVSKRSLVNKATKEDPDLEVFEPPESEPAEKEPSPEPEPSFVPLQNNRLSRWMHPFKKPDQKDECELEIYAKPKFIRARHIPRRWQKDQSAESEDSESESSEEDSECEEEEQEEDGKEKASSKVGASTSSNDSGFDSGRVKDKGSVDHRDASVNPASNPVFALDLNDLPEEVSQSSTYQSFQRSGRITPPATTIPRFRKYCVDDFNFLKVLGKGSFGKVLLAELKGTEYYYAVKCLKKDVVLEDDDVECTLIERKVLALGTKHPYLCHLLCTFQTESHLFFVMEYLNGGDLMFHIQVERRFSEVRARFYGAEIVSGLRFLHNKGIVYRDLKLDNILLDFDGHVRIADFGMCKLQIFLDRMADTFCGTPDYMAPEIIKGQHYNQCVDWWSFGVLLYEMLLGQSPFSGCDEDELFWSICNEKPVIPKFLSAEASSVLLQFLEKDANKRLGNRFSPYGDIQDHPFFKSIDWAALEARKLEPPFKPNLQHPLDTQYFDKTFTVEKAKLTPIETTILQSMDQRQFQGFSYTNPNATDK
ncbi:uncharacterized protein LOC132703757 [Cylas formicarius]|uniref:uncharacterized protein LOC132703757 n=1 Tax=Cylas formicarius TaxID=197179 RepID=UPI0029584818|nr:uncharacterized protein LOC132703757 [Cylas formicarius]